MSGRRWKKKTASILAPSSYGIIIIITLVDVCSTDFHRVSLQLLSKPLSTHTRFNEDRILSKPPFYMILPFVFFFCFSTLGTSQFYIFVLSERCHFCGGSYCCCCSSPFSLIIVVVVGVYRWWIFFFCHSLCIVREWCVFYE